MNTANTSAETDWVCDICGKPATHAVQDIRAVEGTIWLEWEAVPGSVRIRCDDHPTESRELPALEARLDRSPVCVYNGCTCYRYDKENVT